jgi:hypothetical protein
MQHDQHGDGGSDHMRVLADVEATAAHRGDDSVGGVQGVANGLQLLAKQLPLAADPFDQPAALDGQINQLPDSLAGRVVQPTKVFFQLGNAGAEKVFGRFGQSFQGQVREAGDNKEEAGK